MNTKVDSTQLFVLRHVKSVTGATFFCFDGLAQGSMAESVGSRDRVSHTMAMLSVLPI